MAPSRRRTTGNISNGGDERKAESSKSRSNSPDESDGPDKSNSAETCPSCTKESRADPTWDAPGGVKWVQCGACKTWYHWPCVGNGDDLEIIDKWYCKPCQETNPKRTITYNAPARKSNRVRTHRDYANLNSGIDSDPKRFIRMMEGKPLKKDTFVRMKGSDVGVEWLDENDSAMTEPIVVESPEGLGMKMPVEGFTVEDVAELVGKNTPLEVIDVATQATAPGWDLDKWVDYINLEPSARDKILNVISLEVSGTPLADQILPPRLVRELDWVENYWPNTKKGKGHQYPKVQLYCLMGVEGAWTDWHIDFAGSSVYYHIVQGSKIFYFIRPTSSNLVAYERWSSTAIQNSTWLGDMVDEVVKVELTAGNTMFIPTGWIHAVFTPIDTLVFGGNFLHSYEVATQLRVRDIEITTQVPKKFRFPMFTKLCWYVGDKYLRDLKGPAGTSISPRVLSSLSALADFLVSEVRLLERGPDTVKKDTKEQIPSDRVKDAAATARELRWRVRLAAGGLSEDEEEGQLKGTNGNNGNSRKAAQKRKRRESLTPDQDLHSMFRNFRPKAWDMISDAQDSEMMTTVKVKRPRPEDEWKWEMEAGEEDSAEVWSRKNITVKYRQTGNGIERERCERLIEKWTWQDKYKFSAI